MVIILLCLIGTFSPVKFYLNFGHERSQVRKDHRGTPKSGIYCFINLHHFGLYVGQSVNLFTRLNRYLNPRYLKTPKNRNSPISKALLKYGPEGFALLIIEYTPISQLDTREIFWIWLLQPYYNILSGGSAGRGYFHDEAMKAKLSALATGRKHSPATRAFISQGNAGSNNAFFGKTHSPSTLLSMQLANSSGALYLYSALGELLVILPSATTFANLIGSTHLTITSLIASGDLLRGG
jgi:group I intron endonuclease